MRFHRRSSDLRLGSHAPASGSCLLSFPMAGFRRGSGLNAYSCGTVGNLTPLSHPVSMGGAFRTSDSIKRNMNLFQSSHTFSFIISAVLKKSRNTSPVRKSSTGETCCAEPPVFGRKTGGSGKEVYVSKLSRSFSKKPLRLGWPSSSMVDSSFFSSSFCSRVSLVGVSTTTVTYWSPRFL